MIIAITASGLVFFARNIARHDALPDHHDPVGDLEGLLHDVGDDDDADALARHVADHLQTASRLLDAERRKGLVEQDQLAAPMDETIEFDGLALAARQMLDLGAQRRNGGAGRRHGLGDLRFHRAFVEHRNAEPALGQFAAHEEIGDDVDIGAEREVLVDRLDAGALGLRRRLGQERLALEQHLSGRRLHAAGDDLDQRRLAGAVVAEKRHHFTLADREGDALQRFDGAIVLLDVVENEQGFRHAAMPFWLPP